MFACGNRNQFIVHEGPLDRQSRFRFVSLSVPGNNGYFFGRRAVTLFT